MECPACGRNNRDRATFCAWCGHPFEPETPSPSPEATIPVTPSPTLVAPVTDVSPPNPVAAEAPVPVAEASPERKALAVGDLLAERYRISEVLAQGDNGAHYRAVDLLRCLFCGHEQSQPAQKPSPS